MAVTREGSENSLHIPVGIGSVPVQWRWACLEDVCDSIFDCPHSTPKLSNSGPLMVRTQDILSGIFRVDQAVHVSEATYRERTQRAEPTHGDLFYSREGTYFGIAAEVPKNCLVCLGQRMVLIRPNSQAVDFHYLRYWLNSPVMAAHIHGFRDGTVAERLNLPTIRILTVLLPSLPEQRAIAHILGTLDDKIELNRRMNETLEAMARALFKSWFVDFDPVRDKMEGRDTGLPQHLADLFPDRLVDSELGEIPEGWEVSEIGKEVDTVGGATPSTNEPAYWDGGKHHWATPKDLSKLSSPVLLKTDRRITDAGVSKISSGLLPIGTVLLSSRAPIGYLAITEVPTAVNQGFIAMVCKKCLPNVYVLFWCSENLEYIKNISGGSTFAEISKKTFRPVAIIVPTKEVLTVYENTVRLLYDLIVVNTKECASLAQTRNLLLPKLISGELRVMDMERHVSDECT